MDIVTGARVRVVSQHELVRQRCDHEHYGSGLALAGAIGVVDRRDERFGEHCWIVVFASIRLPPFGTVWCDCFAESELVVVESDSASGQRR